jgi:lipopolysaccharide/colanic/teichoic acid biosynthesis glycosyltransferase
MTYAVSYICLYPPFMALWGKRCIGTGDWQAAVAEAFTRAHDEFVDSPRQASARLERSPAPDLRLSSLQAHTIARETPALVPRGLISASRTQRINKRALDIAVSITALLLATPLVILTALAIKLSSPGPVLYVDRRVGRHGRLFRMYKFRSMYRDAERRRDTLRDSNEVTGPVFKMRADPRITPVGRLLRKLSIDELPQLLNVLLGHMSLVGPRPPLPSEYRTYTPRQRRRLSVRPGLTCTWQVSGRSNIPFDQWIDMDLDYIDNWTLGRDLALLVRTIPAVLSGRGAY